MAPNFSIRLRRKNGDLYLTLKGDLDGSSAHALLNVLEQNCNDNKKIFVDINGLRQMLPFGVGVLQGQLSRLKGKLSNIVFTGKNAGSLDSKRI